MINERSHELYGKKNEVLGQNKSWNLGDDNVFEYIFQRQSKCKW